MHAHLIIKSCYKTVCGRGQLTWEKEFDEEFFFEIKLGMRLLIIKSGIPSRLVSHPGGVYSSSPHAMETRISSGLMGHLARMQTFAVQYGPRKLR